MAKALFVVTSYDFLLTGEPTGLWLEELAVPYNKVVAAGHEAHIVSVAGGDVPVDPASLPAEEQIEPWRRAMDALAGTPSLYAVDPEQYDAVYLPGGHGTVFDMPYNKLLHHILATIHDRGGIVAAVCHAPAVFAGMRDGHGHPWIAGRTVAGFTDSEEAMVEGTEKVPFLVERRLRELGARHSGADDWQSHVVRDGRLITGQNPQSSAAVADELLAALES